MFEYYDKDKMLVPIKIWTESIDDIEESCLEQAINLANLPFAHDHIALMPDTHTGKGMPIGGVIAYRHSLSCMSIRKGNAYRRCDSLQKYGNPKCSWR